MSEAAAADTIGLGLAIATRQEFLAFIEKWHDFFLLSGTAAVTLAGLLFIALSLHMEVLVQDAFRGMLVVARVTLQSYITVLIVSIMFLVPESPARVMGASLITFVAVFTVVSLFELRGATRHDHQDFSRRTVRRRVLMPLLGYALIIWVGVGLIRHHFALMYNMIGVMALLLANATWASWDLLVRVSRVKARR